MSEETKAPTKGDEQPKTKAPTKGDSEAKRSRESGKPNLTRAGIEGFLTQKYQEEPRMKGDIGNLSPEEAAAKAKARALEMCPD